MAPLKHNMNRLEFQFLEVGLCFEEDPFTFRQFKLKCDFSDHRQFLAIAILNCGLLHISSMHQSLCVLIGPPLIIKAVPVWDLFLTNYWVISPSHPSICRITQELAGKASLLFTCPIWYIEHQITEKAVHDILSAKTDATGSLSKMKWSWWWHIAYIKWVINDHLLCHK